MREDKVGEGNMVTMSDWAEVCVCVWGRGEEEGGHRLTPHLLLQILDGVTAGLERVKEPILLLCRLYVGQLHGQHSEWSTAGHCVLRLLPRRETQQQVLLNGDSTRK